METIFTNRRKHGECYVSKFPDGLEVPWKPLSIKEFIDYDLELRSGRLPISVIEDEIFQLCVLDDNIKLNADLESAGVATTVVGQIMEFSGPSSPEQIAQDLNQARYLVDNFLTDSIAIILQVFPGYTADKIHSLTYQEYLKLFAMAERRLLQMGVIQEPMQPMIADSTSPIPKKAEVKFKDLNTEPDPYWKPEQQRAPQPKKNSDTIVSGAESGQLMRLPEGMTPEDREVYMHLHAKKWKDDAIEGLDLIYPELMQKLKSGEKITPDTIRQTRGQTPQEVKAKHEQYKKDLENGNIELRPSRPLIATSDNDEGAKPKARRNKG